MSCRTVSRDLDDSWSVSRGPYITCPSHVIGINKQESGKGQIKGNHPQLTSPWRLQCETADGSGRANRLTTVFWRAVEKKNRTGKTSFGPSSNTSDFYFTDLRAAYKKTGKKFAIFVFGRGKIRILGQNIYPCFSCSVFCNCSSKNGCESVSPAQTVGCLTLQSSWRSQLYRPRPL